MVEDLRVCPHCKRYPPDGQVWSDFAAHKRECATARGAKRSDLTPLEKLINRTREEFADVSGDERRGAR